VVDGFGDEWTRFDQAQLSPSEKAEVFEQYFSVFPWSDLPRAAVGADIGCGSGRWATLVAPRVGTLHCVDPSADALAVAARNLGSHENVRFHRADVSALPISEGSLDFVYSLGVLHHVPDTEAAIRSCVSLLKPGAPFLVYLYYAFDNRPVWFRSIWRVSDVVRRCVSRAPYGARYALSQALALAVYWPLARLAALAARQGRDVDAWPLSYYRARSLYVMRTDALDRFGTRLERRFTRREIAAMLERAGLVAVEFREDAPYWVACGRVPPAAAS
jgi:SAM-dependent methyltransferase